MYARNLTGINLAPLVSAFAIGSSTTTVFVSYEDSIKYNMSGENKSCP